jgi:hypothetical protein
MGIVHSPKFVGECPADLLGRAFRGTASLLDHAPGEGLGGAIEAWDLCPLPHMPPTAVRGVDNLGIPDTAPVVGEPELVQDPGPEVVRNHVGPFHNPFKNPQRIWVLHVERHGPLSTVQGLVGRVAAFRKVEGRRDPLRGPFQRLYFQYLCPGIR